MQFIYTTLNETSPAEDEKQQLIDQIKIYEDLLDQLINKSDIVQYNPMKNNYRIFVSKYNNFFIEITHCYECRNLWKITKAVYEYRLNNQGENKND